MPDPKQTPRPPVTLRDLLVGPQLPPEEAAFQRWYGDWARRAGMNPDPDAPGQDYDYRAAFRAGVTPPPPGGHWPSTFKSHAHQNLVVGGFHTQTGERVPGTPRAKDAAELERLGWDRETAARLASTPEPSAPLFMGPREEAAGPRQPVPRMSLRSLLTGVPEAPLPSGPIQYRDPSVPEASDWLLKAGDFLRGLSPIPIPGPESKANLTGQLLSAAIPVVGGAKAAKMALGEVVREGARGGPVVGRVLRGGFYSRVDEAVGKIPAKGAHPNKVAGILKSNASAEELAYRGVPEFLAAQGNKPVTPEALQAHLAAHPAPFPEVKTLGVSPADQAQARVEQAQGALEDYLTREQGFSPHGVRDYTLDAARAELSPSQLQAAQSNPQQWALTQDLREAYEARRATGIAGATPTKYANYTVPGGENYRETLLTLPEQPHNPYEAFTTQMEKKYGVGYDTAALTPDEQTMQGMLWDRSQRTGSGMTESQFRSSHFDQPNVLVHTRANERTLPTGARGRFVEEVQSDWHQKGKEQGYRPSTPEPPLQATKREGYWEVNTDQGDFVTNVYGTDAATPEAAVAEAQRRLYREPMRTAADERVPDAPFKEAWPDLGVKQQLIEAAQDPYAEWLGMSSGPTQVNRWGSERITWAKEGDGFRVKFEPQVGGDALGGDLGAEALARGLTKNESTYVEDAKSLAQLLSGSEVKAEKAWKRIQASPEGGTYLPRKEGMEFFYDQLLPKRVEKILAPLGGGPVERVPLNAEKTAKLAAQNEFYYESGAISEAEYLKRKADMEQTVEAWMARLTPELKQKIRDQGLPLLTLLGATSLGALVRGGEAPGRHAR